MIRVVPSAYVEPRGHAQPSPGPPNLFTGPGQLKNARRGRPTPSKTSSTAPGAVDLTTISTASEQIARTTTPLVTSPTGTPALAASPSQVPPSRSNSASPSGFDDDAWTNRPSSTKPVAPTPTIPVRAPSVPPTSTGGGLAMTDADIFDQLARLSQLRVQIPATAAPPAPSPGIASPPAVPAMSGYNHGLGASHAPPLGPHPTLSLPLQGLSTGLLSPSGVRGPFAPVPVSCLRALRPHRRSWVHSPQVSTVTRATARGPPALPCLSRRVSSQTFPRNRRVCSQILPRSRRVSNHRWRRSLQVSV
ncbi:hypothetical protein EDB85DRAFT_1347394 [Lactarius pseudohatsudake]|nr:hypothetical protein EDB85DRAFT_1347394 [Lactarius pseudohatsudake]